MAMTYALLNQLNPAYQRAQWDLLDDLYEGGFRMRENAAKYLPRAINEHPERYRERLQSAAYLNYMALVIDNFRAGLLQEPVRVLPKDPTPDANPYDGVDAKFWGAFSQNADLKGTSFSQLLGEMAQHAMLKRRALLGLDFPRIGVQPQNLAEEEAMGASRAYAFTIPLEQMIDWEYGDTEQRVINIPPSVTMPDGGQVSFTVHRFRWCILKRTLFMRPRPEDLRAVKVEEFKIWRLGEDGFAAWELYQSVTSGNAAIKPETVMAPVSEGRTSFRQIPVLELEMPHALWVGNRIGPVNLEHFQRRTMLVSSEAKSLFAIPVAYLSGEVPAMGGALPSEAAMNPHRGNDPVAEFRAKGYTVLGEKDRLEFSEPSGGCYQLTSQGLKDLVDEIFRIGQQMASSVSNTSVALGRSGASKTEDNKSTVIVLKALGAILSDFAIRVHKVIAMARGENVEWTVQGLSGYDAEDPMTLIEQAKHAGLVTIPSLTFKRIFATKLARSLVGPLDPSVLGQIDKEIEEAKEEDFYTAPEPGVQDAKMLSGATRPKEA